MQAQLSPMPAELPSKAQYARRCMTLGIVGALGALLWLGCREPTQMLLRVTTDQCAHAPRIAINVGLSRKALLDDYTSRKATLGRDCVEGDSLGTLVFTPGAASASAIVYVSIRAAFDGRDPLDCVPANNFAGCVIARRSFRYTSATPLELPVRILAECIDEPCTGSDEGYTCSNGRVCVPESTTCEANKSCVLGDAGGRDARSDGATLDGASVDAAKNNSGKCVAGDLVVCGLLPNAETCVLPQSQCCSTSASPGTVTCNSCNAPARKTRYCCSDSAQCGDLSKYACFRHFGEPPDPETYSCGLVADALGQNILCGGGPAEGGQCPNAAAFPSGPALSRCSPIRGGDEPFHSCIGGGP